MKTEHNLLAVALLGTLAFTSCNKKGDAISSAEQADKKAGIAAPSIEETKAIAEDGFIYGLPILIAALLSELIN